ncbi:MAG: hypothetical protein Kow0068_24060 [Marinilabiliales bacterium]
MDDNQSKRKKSLLIDDGKYYTFFTKKFENRKPWIKLDEKEIRSFIPGTITKVFVKDGQKIRKNQKLFVLEAMKMNNTVFSEEAGVVEKVFVKPGDKIPKSFVVIKLK